MKIEIGKTYWYYSERKTPYLSYPHPPKQVRADSYALGFQDHFVIQIDKELNIEESFEQRFIYEERPTEKYKQHLAEYIENMEASLNILKERLKSEN